MMKTDIEIAQECMMEPITKVAEKAGIPEEYLEQYGKYKAFRRQALHRPHKNRLPAPEGRTAP